MIIFAQLFKPDGIRVFIWRKQCMDRKDGHIWALGVWQRQMPFDKAGYRLDVSEDNQREPYLSWTW